MNRIVLSTKNFVDPKFPYDYNVSLVELPLKQTGPATYISGRYYDDMSRSIKVDSSIEPTHVIIMPTINSDVNGTPCPECLAKFLSKVRDQYCVDMFGHVNYKQTGMTYGSGDVSTLHWGMSGDVATCYTCMGCPDEKPEY